jgi:hypothetical protein
VKNAVALIFMLSVLAVGCGSNQKDLANGRHSLAIEAEMSDGTYQEVSPGQGSSNSQDAAAQNPFNFLCDADTQTSKRGTPIFLEDIVDGKDGEYRLVSLTQGIEAKATSGKLGGYFGQTTLSPKAEIDNPTANQEVLCSDLEQLSAPALFELSNEIPFPWIIKRKKGQIVRDLTFQFRFTKKKKEMIETKSYRFAPAQAASLHRFQKQMEDFQGEIRYYRVGKEDFEIYATGSFAGKTGHQMSVLIKAVFQFVPSL